MRKQMLNAGALLLGLFCCANCGTSDAATAKAAPQEGVRFYYACPGDSFAMLAGRTGYDKELLAAMNNLSPGYFCRGGEKLRLPAEDIIGRAAPASRGGETAYREAIGTKIWQPPLQGVITSAFAGQRSAGPHHGVDVAAEQGTAIRAAHSGRVVEAGWQNSIYGYAVLIDHGNGWQTHYAHCSKVLVKAGEAVKQGQQIALVGSTGNSTGPHLHLELIKDGVFLTPVAYFSGLAV